MIMSSILPMQGSITLCFYDPWMFVVPVISELFVDTKLSGRYLDSTQTKT